LLLVYLVFFFYYYIKNKQYYFYFLFDNDKFARLHMFFNKAMLFDYLYNSLLYKYFLYNSYFLFYKKLEKGIFEFFGPQLVSRSFFKAWSIIGYLNTGLVYNYVFNMIYVMTILIVILEFFVWLSVPVILCLSCGYIFFTWILFNVSSR
jgi:hypothetical protein